MKLAVRRETREGERRVALVPESVARLIAKGVEVAVEPDAGLRASFSDQSYREAGASVETAGEALFGSADVVVGIQAREPDEVRAMAPGSTLVGLVFPLVNTALVRALADGGLSCLALDRIPRITLAQSMDVLSSQSTVAGYRAVVLAAAALPKFFPLLMTAAGKVDPARVLVLGAGVAGLQAIAIARRLGAVVEAYDVRAVVKEQVESLGASFIEVGLAQDDAGSGGYAKTVTAEDQARADKVIAGHLEKTNVCITTALIPGRPAPRLLSKEMVARMPAGSVVVDLAAEQGGNCELTQPGQTIETGVVRILGPANLPSEVPYDASRMFSRNVEKLVLYLLADGRFELDLDKEIVSGSIVTLDGKIMHEDIEQALATGV